MALNAPVKAAVKANLHAPLQAQLQAVFGDCIPKENATALLEASPLAPSTPAARQALCEAVLAHAGEKIANVANIGSANSTTSALTTSSNPTTARPLPAGARLQFAQVQASRERTTSDGLQKLLSPARTASVFKAAAAMRDIPWNFLEEGCVHRSHVLAKRLEDQGVYCEKVFTIPQGGDLVMNSDKARLGFTVCWYHEAVVVHMQTLEGSQRMVIDPSVADEPITVDAWLSTMEGTNNAPLETFYLPRFAYGLGARDNPPNAWVDDELRTAQNWGNTWQDTEKVLLDMNFYDELKKLAGRA